MPLQIASLNSGSNANCYYVGNADEAVLVDAGLSCRETLKRMDQLGLNVGKLKAIFISHEHADHINGLAQLHRKLELPVFITEKTLMNTAIRLKESLVNHFIADTCIEIGALKIVPFSKHHDAADPHSFIINGDGVNVGVITDVGHACRDLIHYFRQCDAAFLETNYCEAMLTNGSYPLHLKKRISGKNGHLSNNQALELFIKHKSKHLQLLLLSHLSQNNNTPEKALSVFNTAADQVKIVVAGREKASEVYAVTTKNKRDIILKVIPQPAKQLSLFS